MRIMLWRPSVWLLAGLLPVVLLVGSPLQAQAQQQCAYLHVEGATATAVGVLWSHGFDDDDAQVAGLVRVVTACRLERVRRLVPDTLASGMRIGNDYSLVFGVVAAGDAKLASQFLSTLLAEQSAGEILTDDVVALAVARAALAADDAEFVYPGDVLLARARQHFGRATAFARPPAGIARAIAKLTPAMVRKAMRIDVPVRMAVLGVVDAALINAVRPLAPTLRRGFAASSFVRIHVRCAR